MITHVEIVWGLSIIALAALLWTAPTIMEKIMSKRAKKRQELEQEDPTAGMRPDAAGARRDAARARETAGDDRNKCTGCGHLRERHPSPYGACTECIYVAKHDASHVVCGVFRRD